LLAGLAGLLLFQGTAGATGVTLDDTDGNLTYAGTWPTQSSGSYYGGSEHLSNSSSASVTFPLTVASGTTATVTLVGEISTSALCTAATMSVDGATATTFSEIGASHTYQTDVVTTADLAAGAHMVVWHPCSGAYLIVDAVRTDTTTIPTTTTSTTSSTTTSTTAPPTTTTTAPPDSGGTLTEPSDDAKRAAGAACFVVALTCGLVSGRQLFR
jgi:hypothetical protein